MLRAKKKSPQVLIVGAGPTGLVLALELAERGIPLRIIDSSSGPGQASRAMAVHARTLEFYQQLGIAEEVIAEGIKGESIHLRENKKDIVRISFKDMGQGLSPFPFVLCYPQDDHERLLVKKLAELGVAVEWGVELQAFTQTSESVRAILVKGGEREIYEVPYLCGCDGARSRVRQHLGLGFGGGTDKHLFYVADVKTAGEFKTDIYANLEVHDFGLMFPVRSSGMQRLIGIVPNGMEQKPKLTFEDIRETEEALLGIRVQEVNWFSTYHVHHRVADRFQVGRCFVLGDAGHIHSPVGGQGMNTGIGDAVNLAWKLAEVLQEKASATLLTTYEAERIIFARQLVKTTDTAFQYVVNQKHGNLFLRMWLLPRLLAFATRFFFVRQLMFKGVSQIEINYRKSPLSVGVAGKVRGGDRLPWVKDNDNFSVLRSMRWQVHVYGSIDTTLREQIEALGLPVHVFAWNDSVAAVGLAQNALYLIRPDGYVALASEKQDKAVLEKFAKTFGLLFK